MLATTLVATNPRQAAAVLSQDVYKAVTLAQINRRLGWALFDAAVAPAQRFFFFVQTTSMSHCCLCCTSRAC